MGGEIQLAAHAMERVQSFLSSKEAARTACLSKSWGVAWLTRPNLDFDMSDFGVHDHGQNICNESWYSFLKFVDKTMKRYEVSNLKIQSFRLRMNRDSSKFMDFTRRALNIGATHDLSIQLEGSLETVVPDDVFASENLAALTVKGCAMDLRQLNVIRCSRLRSLCLERVTIKGGGSISIIILSCPLIQKLLLSHIRDIPWRYDGVLRDCLNNLCRLRSMVLMSVHIDTLFLSDLSTNSPFLKDLTLCNCELFIERDEILISSRSLERLDLTIHTNFWKVMNFDVPSIRRFTCQGTVLPSVSFGSTSRRWESHVSITVAENLSAFWFRCLRKFLSELCRSRIYLSLHFYTKGSFNYKAGEIQGLPTHIIDNLTINLQNMPSLTWYAVWDGLFRMCRPKFITQTSNVDFLGQTLLHGLTDKVSTPSRFMYGLNDLKEARAQIFDKDVSMWRDVPLESLLDHDSTTQNVRFKLKWQPHVAAA